MLGRERKLQIGYTETNTKDTTTEKLATQKPGNYRQTYIQMDIYIYTANSKVKDTINNLYGSAYTRTSTCVCESKHPIRPFKTFYITSWES